MPKEEEDRRSARQALGSYLAKWSGEATGTPGKFPSLAFVLVMGLAGFVSLGVMTAAHELSSGEAHTWMTIIGSYGATAVLVFGSPSGPFSQPRNVIGGQVIAALVGVGCRVWVAEPMGSVGLAVPLSVTLSFFLMQLTRTVNPPAGGTAALAVLADSQMEAVGWGLVVPAVLWGVVFVFVACVLVNVLPDHRYPKYWFVEPKVYARVCQSCSCCGGVIREKDERDEGKAPTTQEDQVAKETADVGSLPADEQEALAEQAELGIAQPPGQLISTV